MRHRLTLRSSVPTNSTNSSSRPIESHHFSGTIIIFHLLEQKYINLEQQLKDANIKTTSKDCKKTKKLYFPFNGKNHCLTFNKDKKSFVSLTISNGQSGQKLETIKKDENIILTRVSALINNMPVQQTLQLYNYISIIIQSSYYV